MEWTNLGDMWQSGPFKIELLAPEQWRLSRTEELGVNVDSGEEWTSRSLSRLKRRAETLVEEEREVTSRRRTKILLAAAILVLVVTVPEPGRVSAILAIAAFSIAVYATVRLFDSLIRSRPWDRLNEGIQ